MFGTNIPRTTCPLPSNRQHYEIDDCLEGEADSIPTDAISTDSVPTDSITTNAISTEIHVDRHVIMLYIHHGG